MANEPPRRVSLATSAYDFGVTLPPALVSLLGLTTACTTATEYEQARLEWLMDHVGFDTLYIGAAAPEPSADVRFAGVASDYVDRCESNADRYWPCRLRINQLAERAGGVIVDADALSVKEREAMPFYREVTHGLGIRNVAACVLGMAGRPQRAIYLGRTSRGSQFARGLPLLRAARAVLALGAEVHDAGAAAARARALPGLTVREREVMTLVCRGYTNREVAAAFASSPRTVKNQVASILCKTGASNRTELAASFAEEGPTRSAAIVELRLRRGSRA